MSEQMSADGGVRKSRKPRAPRVFPSIREETRINVDTETAAHWLSRSPATLYEWSSRGIGPLKPRRIGGMLAWNVDEIRALSEGAQ